jgi:glycine dehydrogenase subunit 2
MPIRKATPHVTQNEGLIFERSSTGRRGYDFPKLDVPEADLADALGDGNVRPEIDGFPEVSEVDVIRHFTRLSTWNHSIDIAMYPLGSCTMKYNPRINERVSRLEGIALSHPLTPESKVQGNLEILKTTGDLLAEITGMDQR